MSIDVSVIMSVYNGEPFLGEAIDGILNQSHENFEFIVIDDGSTDGSGERLMAAAQKDSRVLFLENNESMGLTRSLNIGLSKATGRFIARQDADDISLPTRLTKQVAFLEKHPEVGVLGSGYEDVDSQGQTLSVNLPPKEHFEIVWHLCIGANVIAHPSAIFRADLLKANGGYDESFKRSQDYALWGSLLHKTKFANLEEVLIKRRVHPDQISTAASEKQSESSLRALKRVGENVFGREFAAGELEALVSLVKPGKGCSKLKLKIATGLLVELYESLSATFNLTMLEKARLRELTSERVSSYPISMKARSDLSGRELLFELLDRIKKRFW